MKTFKALITFAIPFDEIKSTLPNWEFIYPTNERFTEEELLVLIKDCDVIITVYGQKLSNQVIDAALQLKMIANFGAGYDNVDVAYATSKKILVSNSPDPVTEPTAELALGLMIAVARRIGEMNNLLHQKETLTWGVMRNLSTTLVNKRIGIVGLGAIGKAMAKRAIASGMEVVYYSRNRVSADIETQYQAHYMPLQELIATADVVSLHVPLNQESKHLISTSEFERMKSTAFLINTARGAVVDEKALVNALQNKQIAGAGLDVYEDEPHISEALLTMSNVVLVPHLGTATHETRKEMSLVVAHNIKCAFEDLIVPNGINRKGLF